QPQSRHVTFDEELYGPSGHRASGEAVLALAPCCLRWTEQRPRQVVANGRGFEPVVEALEGFRVQWDAALLAAFAVDLQHLVAAGRLVAANFEPNQLPDAAAGIGQDGEEGAIAETYRRCRVWGIQQPAALLRG